MQASPVVLTEGMTAPAPSYTLFGHSADLPAQVARKPLVIAFVSAFCESGGADEADVERIRAEVRGLDATLLVLSPHSVWCFGPDDRLFKRGAASGVGDDDLSRAFFQFGVPPCAITESAGHEPLRGVFVIDTAQTILFAHIKPLLPAYPVSSLRPAKDLLLKALVIATDAMEATQKTRHRPSLTDSALAGLVAGFRQVAIPVAAVPARIRKNVGGDDRALPW